MKLYQSPIYINNLIIFENISDFMINYLVIKLHKQRLSFHNEDKLFVFLKILNPEQKF